MVRLGLTPNCGVEASDISLQREGPSYTVDTVAQVRAMYPDAKLYLLLGDDMLPSFPDWREPEKILQDAALAVFCRDGEEAKQAKENIEAIGGEVVLLDNPVTNISSTQLRRMLVFRCASEFIPQKVEEFIYGNGLYGTGVDYRHLPEEKLEQVVTGLLKPSRVKHVLGCRETAVELARLYGVDETDAARAALLHDITKALDGPLQLTLCRSYDTILDDFSTKNPKTLHARTGSLVAERIFGENQAVVDAIRCHTTGKADMNLLEKIIYVADYMEPNRDFPGVEKLRRLAYTDITQALELGLRMTLAMLTEQGREISPESLDALSYLEINR
jgi:nicotinate-nucleotide adenylyltransferase